MENVMLRIAETGVAPALGEGEGRGGWMREVRR